MLGAKKYGIVVLPNSQVAADLRSLSQKIANNQLPLGKSADCHPYPHLSLLHVLLDCIAENEARYAFSQLELLPVPDLTLTGVSIEDNGWCFVHSTLNPQLRSLQMQVVNSITPHRSGDISVEWDMSKLQQIRQKRYGYPNIGKAWSPHFTVGITSQADQSFQFEAVWTPKKIAFCKVGKNGRVKAILETRKLS